MKYQMIDLTGQRFGMLEVIKPDHNDNKRGWWWLCRCDCGNEKIIPSGNLRSGSCISCGCYHRGDEKKNLMGQRFGRLKVIAKAEDEYTPSGRKITKWLCECDCGNTKIVSAWHLKGNNIQSCGCYWQERRIESNTTHGMSKTRLYTEWSSMKSRCGKEKGYENITYCEEWSKFENFRDWALCNGYEDNLTIDRKDFTGNYEPSNCRWATLVQQANNTRKNHYITIDGVTHTLTEWSRMNGILAGTIKDRINRGWSEEDAATIKPRCKRKNIDMKPQVN